MKKAIVPALLTRCLTTLRHLLLIPFVRLGSASDGQRIDRRLHHPSTTIRVMEARVPRISIVFLSLVVALATVAPASGQMSATVFADDGTALATDIYWPLRFGPHPVILIRTPYGRDGMAEPCIVFALLGYACVAQDTRGRGDSGGADTVFRDEADDGRATIAWLAEQPWCDGNIGMFGGSAFAITQYLPAPGANSALRSISPVVATPDLYHHAFLQGGAIREALAVNWLNGQDSGFFFDEVREHRLKDAWWDWAEVLEQSGSIHASGLHVGGWYDIFGQGTLDAFTALQHDGGSGAVGRQYLIMGPWTHGGLFTNLIGALIYPLNAVRNPLDMLLPWYDATLRGDTSEIDGWPAARIYLMGAVGEAGAPGNEWVDLDEWPPPVQPRQFYLSAAEWARDGRRPAGPAPHRKAVRCADLHHRSSGAAGDGDGAGASKGLAGAGHPGPRSGRSPDRCLSGRTINAGARRHPAGADALRRRHRVPSDSRGAGGADCRAVVNGAGLQRRPPHPDLSLGKQLAALRGQPQQWQKSQSHSSGPGGTTSASLWGGSPIPARAAGAVGAVGCAAHG